jgi:transposase
MKTLASWGTAPNLNVIAVEAGERTWIVSVDNRDAEQDRDRASCPVCGTQSSSRHSSYTRTLRDLSAQGRPVNIRARLTRWRCRNDRCDRRIFAERLPMLATPYARRTARLSEIVWLFGHSVGGRPSERLMARLGMPVSDTTILRSVKERAGAQRNRAVVRVAGIDEWAWRKGTNFGTVIVDLERRQVVDLLADRSAATTADWLKRYPEIEVVSRDRAGLYADAARQGAPQARQVADRFHLLKNFRETVERQLGRFEAPVRESPLQVEDDPDPHEQPVIERSDGCSEVAVHERLLRRGRDAARKEMFDQIRALYEAGHAVTEIARKLGLGPRRVYRWVRRIDLPEPSTMAPKTCTPAYFGAFLARSWAEGTTKVRHLFSDIRHRGYTGSFSHLARFLAPWRSSSPSGNAGEPPSLDEEAHAPPHV